MKKIILLACLMLPAAATAQSCPQPLFEHQVDRVAKFTDDATIAAIPSMEFQTEPENLIQFVVDTLGRPDSTSLKFLRAGDTSIVKVVRRVITSWKFTPATVKGRKVCQLVQTPVVHQRRPSG